MVFTAGWLFLYAALLPLPTTDGARILFIVGNINSHVLLFSRIADDLAKLGHVTEILVPSNARRPDFVSVNAEESSSSIHPNFTYTTYPVSAEEPFSNSRQVSEAFMQMALSRSAFERFQILASFASQVSIEWEEDCRQMIENEELMNRIRSFRFEFAVIDPVASQCYYVLPYSLHIPYATMSVPTCSWFYRVPRLPSFVSASLGYTDRMSFFQRLQTFAADMAMLTLVNDTTYYVDKYASDRPALLMLQFVEKSSLWFFMEDPAVGYALPHMPNTLAVGDIMAGRPGQRLSAELDRFVSGAKRGVIIVSFGSYFDHVPDNVAAKFCDAFERQEQAGRRVIWKFGNVELCAGSKNVRTMKWIPQNDLLADDRVKLFISHGGLNSVIEAAYHAKPMIVFPIAVDQPGNAAAAESKGFAIRMDIGDFTTESLLEAIDRILAEPSFSESARLASALLRDRKDTPAERMSHMIEHVLKYGDSHLRTGAYELNTLQFYMFDIFAAIFFALLALLAAVVCCCRCCCQCCRRLLRGKTVAEKRKAD